jgi:hypothetical protein
MQASPGSSVDAFVTKLNAAGSALIYSTYLGGNNFESALSIALDPSGNAYVAGSTGSSNFPTVNAVDSTLGGTQDAFVAKFNAAGSALVYSTFIGGSAHEEGDSIAVDTSGSAYLSGYTESSNFPTVDPLQGVYGGGGDAFIVKVNAAGSALTYSTYLGGTGSEAAHAVAVDNAGNAYLTGLTASAAFPTKNPLQASITGLWDAFITKIADGPKKRRGQLLSD